MPSPAFHDRNVAAHLPRAAAADPDALAVAFPIGRPRPGAIEFSTLSLEQLDRDSRRDAAALTSLGIRAGDRVVLMVPPGGDFFRLVFALFRLRCVPVLVDPGIGIRNLGRCLKEAAPSAFIGVAKAHIARVLLGWARPTVAIRVLVGRGLPGLATSLDRVRARFDASALADQPPTHDEDLAAILFTSGSTGVPKGALYTHGMFNAQIDLIRAVWGIAPGERDLSTFPLFALFGPALGMASIVPPMDASRPGRSDPRLLLETIERFSCTNMFASPAIVDLLGRHTEASAAKIPSLRRVISAGAPATPRALARLARALDQAARVHTPYGATECLPVADIDHRTILDETHAETVRGRGVCVGLAVPGVQVDIIAIDDGPLDHAGVRPLPAGEIGEVVVSGPVVSQGYFGRPEADALAKLPAQRDHARPVESYDASGPRASPEAATRPEGRRERLRHRTGDIGWIDPRGRLWICGRKAHRVETTRGEVLHSICVEAVFDAEPGVRRTALVGVPSRNGEMGPHPVLCVEVEAGTPANGEARRALIERLRARGQATPQAACITDFEFHPRFPTDVRHNAKIHREALAIWATRRRRALAAPTVDSSRSPVGS